MKGKNVNDKKKPIEMNMYNGNLSAEMSNRTTKEINLNWTLTVSFNRTPPTTQQHQRNAILSMMRDAYGVVNTEKSA